MDLSAALAASFYLPLHFPSCLSTAVELYTQDLYPIPARLFIQAHSFRKLDLFLRTFHCFRLLARPGGSEMLDSAQRTRCDHNWTVSVILIALFFGLGLLTVALRVLTVVATRNREARRSRSSQDGSRSFLWSDRAVFSGFVSGLDSMFASPSVSNA